MKYPATPAKIISRMGWEMILSADFSESALFFMNSGKIVKKHTTAKISQLLQSMKLTEGWLIGLISRSAAAPIIPNTDNRNICIVRLK